jgi:hypothetical protein
VIPTQSPKRPAVGVDIPFPGSDRWRPVVVGGLLLLYVLMAVSATTQKSTTFDEVQHLTLGFLYWTQPSGHLLPEAGIFAQAWATLPLLTDHLRAPLEMGEPWSKIGSWAESQRFFYSLGNDPSAMLLQARTMISLLGASLGALVFLWSRELFGTRGGYLSLLLFVFCPNMLAHGALVTADMVAALGFFAATFSFWKLSHRVSWLNLLFSVLALCGLALAKMSAFLILPIFGLILAVRFVSRRPIEFQLFRYQMVEGRFSKAAIWSLLLVLQLVAVVGFLWLAYNFQYSTRPQNLVGPLDPGSPNFSFWSGAALKSWLIQNISQTGLLPPAYLEGLRLVLQASESRSAFLCGSYSEQGWWWFFPFAFLIKTPIASLLLFFFSLVTLVFRSCFPIRWATTGSSDSRGPSLYDLSPLLILGGIYGLVCLTSHLDIGLRHLLPVYPVLFVLAGANTFWLTVKKIVGTLVLAALLAGTVAESLGAWPNYLAFFNQLVGGPRNGYQYLVDSSLDWGQDLPGLHYWLEKNLPEASNTNVYLSYFGTGDPKYYGIKAHLLPGYLEADTPQYFPLRDGVYCLSATMLQGVYSRFHRPWTPANEALYGQVLGAVNQWRSTANDAIARDHLLKEHGAEEWTDCFNLYGALRLARLCAYLRHRVPDAEIGYSILIYRLSDAEIRLALGGASPEG